AEDGIRDFHVTGVQTCALPIFITSNGFYRFAEIFKLQDKSVWPVTQDKNGGIWLAWAAAQIGKAVYNPQSKVFDWYDGEFTRTRSEERRVGKSVEHDGRRSSKT